MVVADEAVKVADDVMILVVVVTEVNDEDDLIVVPMLRPEVPLLDVPFFSLFSRDTGHL